MSLLHQAIQQQHTRQIKLLTTNGVNVNQRDSRMRTPLHLVCDIENQSLATRYAQILLDFGAHVQCKNDQGFTVFYYACVKQRLPLLRLILKEREVDYFEADCEGNTPLHYAASAGNTSLVTRLVKEMRKYGIGVDRVNDHGETAMMLAGKYGHDRCERILRESGKASDTIRDRREFRTVNEWRNADVESRGIDVSAQFRLRFPELCKNLVNVPLKVAKPKKKDSKTSLSSNSSIASTKGLSIKQTLPALFEKYKDQIATSYRKPAKQPIKRLSYLQDNENKSSNDWLEIEGVGLKKSYSCGSLSEMELSSEWTNTKSFYKTVTDLTSRSEVFGQENKNGRSIRDTGDVFIDLSRGYTFPASRKD